MSDEERKAKRRERNKAKRIEKAKMLLKYVERPGDYKSDKSWKAAVKKAQKLLASE